MYNNKNPNNLDLSEWIAKFGGENSARASAELAARFMFAMAYYHDRMRLHILLHPLFFLAGFVACYFLVK